MRGALLVILLILSGPAAADTCFVDQGGQYGSITMCVSSVLPPERANTYGPEHLIGRAENENKAWCEGVPGPGIGESITEKLDGLYSARRLSIINGYAKSDQAFHGNNRIRSAILQTSRGYRATVTLKDTREPQAVEFPKAKISWLKLTIASVYSGAHDDTCVSQFAIGLDDEEP